MLVLLVACISCAATTVLFVFYFVFRKQNHRWWWRAYYFGCVTGLLVMGYSVIYINAVGASGGSAFVLYFTDMLLFSLALATALGFVGISSAMWFSRRLYGVFEDESLDDHIEMNDAVVAEKHDDTSQCSTDRGSV